MNNHQKPTFHQLSNFFKPSLSPARTKFNKITNSAKIEFLLITLIYAKASKNSNQIYDK